ncbi:hypothetical protein FKG94_03230 [Exilibacterium tricleocarpae]|uniref:Uncharacterized protein n=1 Tax=Exilibacterium tricleocarpae TaxID=2591008 RepID=A0A545U6X0_9GAMM|nr:hypothetical protein [Exilibacterium tricleocarpae]TQV85216.1 hypothetical protein FKG94_03230 [Exilibacterium tricleocarpae]
MKNIDSTDRYMVLDTEDIGDALSFAEIKCLRRLEKKIDGYRQSKNKPPLQYGVVDPDWDKKLLDGRTVVQSITHAENSRRPFSATVSMGLLTIESGINPIIQAFQNSYHSFDLGVQITNRAGFVQDIVDVLSRKVPGIGAMFYASTNTAAVEALSQGSQHAAVKCQYNNASAGE